MVPRLARAGKTAAMKHAEWWGSIQVRQPSGRWEHPAARRYRTIDIQASEHVITVATPLPDDLRQALGLIHGH